MTSAQDPGLEAVSQMASIWVVDPARVVARENGFDWWPGDFRVTVSADRGPDDTECWRLSVRTAFLADVPVEDDGFVRLMGLTTSVSASTYASVYPPAEAWARFGEPQLKPGLWMAGTAYLRPITASWLPAFFARMSVMQPINAQIQAAGLADALGAGTPETSRPDALRGQGLDEILGAAEGVYAPAGQERNNWVGTGEFERFVSEWSGSDLFFGTADATGLTLETPFGSNSALIMLRTDQQHPQLGTGLLATVQLPLSDDLEPVARECAWLNFSEASLWTDFPLLGCWHPYVAPGGLSRPAFTSFIPNAVYQPNLATQTALWQLQRARWVRQLRFPDWQDSAVRDIQLARMATPPGNN